MDNTKVFDTLERKIERMLTRLRSLDQENEKLKGDLAAARRSEKDAADSRASVERLERDHTAVRERQEKLIAAHEAAEGKG
jgi:FtsZ-binding cell division protein ZapB